MMLPSAPPITSENGSAVRQSARGVRESQNPSRPEMPRPSTVKNHFCQPPASARKLKAAPVL